MFYISTKNIGIFFNIKFISSVLLSLVLTACSNSDDDPDPKIENPSLSSENTILSFNLLRNENFCEREVSNSIDDATGVIEIEVTNSTSIQSITPTITIPEGARISPIGAQNFSNPVIYTVTAEDESTTEYEVRVVLGPTEREILEKLYDMNPGNSTGWDLDEADISNWQGVGTNSNGKVESLVLQSNNIVNFPKELSHLCSLNYFVVNGNELTTIPDVIFELKNVTSLSIINAGLTSLQDDIGKLINITELVLVLNQIETISGEIGKLENLQYFQLGENQLQALPKEIGQLKNLLRLNIDRNILIEIPSEIDQLENLEDLTLGENNLTMVPSNLDRLLNLESLILNDNQITTIPTEIGSILNLQQLRLQGNSIVELPIEISNLSNLAILDIGGNNLNSIPSEICDMTANYGTQIFKGSQVTCD